MRWIYATTIALAAITAPAWAQTDETIIVTATRTPTPLSRLPARADVATRAEIESQSLVTLSDALGAEAVQSGGAGQQSSLFLRGANSKHALALLDGVRINDASTPNGQYDFGLDTLGGLDRVEILRGPASAIYGSDAIGGVVNMIPRRGGEAPFEAFIEAAAGSFETYRALAGAAGAEGGYSYGLTAERYDSEGYDLIPERMATHTGDPDGATITTLTGSARVEARALAFDALARWRDSETAFDTFSGGPFFDRRADDPDLSNESRQSLWRLGAEAYGVRLAMGQVRSDRREQDSGVQTSAAEATQSFADLSARLGDDAFSLTGGITLERDEIDTTPAFSSPLSVEEDHRAAYAIVQAQLHPRLDATASARVDDYDGFDTHATYAIGLVADLTPLRLYASAGTAFKAPSLSERYETSLFNIGNPELEPERSRSYEVGADFEANAAFRGGVSLYRTSIRDLIEYDFLQLQNVNIGRADIDGVEAYLELRPRDWLTLRGEYSWTDARNAVTGAQLARRPTDAWRIEARAAASERLNLALSWRFVGERTDVTYNDDGTFRSGSERVSGFDVGSLAATYDLSRNAELFMRIDNITDETYEQPAAFAGSPRNATAGLRARF